MYDRAISAPSSPTRLNQSGKRSWEEPNWLGSSSRLLSQDMKTNLSRSLQTLPTESSATDTGTEQGGIFVLQNHLGLLVLQRNMEEENALSSLVF